MNWDGFASIVGDTRPFVNVVYFGDYAWYDQQFPGKDPRCPGDCNGSGYLSIVGDVPCFVDCVYFGNCEGPLPTPVATTTGQIGEGTFTIGGAIYSDLDNPLTSGAAGVHVTVVGDGGTFAAETTSAQGLWVINGVPAGTYDVTPSAAGKCFSHIGQGSLSSQSSITITVNSTNEASNQSIQFLTSSPVPADLDHDCDVDQADLNQFVACSEGPTIPLSPGCEGEDFDGDSDVDLTDFAILQRCYSGEGKPAHPKCAE